MKGRQPATVSVVLFLACSVRALGLAACGAGGEDGGGNEGTSSAATGTATAATSGGPVEITMWHAEVAANLDTLQNLVRRYNSSQNEVQVKLAYQGSDKELMTTTASCGGCNSLHP